MVQVIRRCNVYDVHLWMRAEKAILNLDTFKFQGRFNRHQGLGQAFHRNRKHGADRHRTGLRTPRNVLSFLVATLRCTIVLNLPRPILILSISLFRH